MSAALRRSTRLQTQSASQIKQRLDRDGSSGDSVAATKSTQTSSSASEPVNKRIGAAAVQSPVKRRKTFQPSNAAQEQPCAVSLGTLPADVVLEIGSHLDLRSLWNLHRISKPLHAVFASKHSRKIWAQAMKSIDLPEVAMAAPLLAQLLLDQGCMVCGKKNVKDWERNVDYAAQAVYCDKCYAHALRTKSECKRELADLGHDIFDLTFECTPYTFDPPGRRKLQEHPVAFYFKPRIAAVNRKLANLIDTVEESAGGILSSGQWISGRALSELRKPKYEGNLTSEERRFVEYLDMKEVAAGLSVQDGMAISDSIPRVARAEDREAMKDRKRAIIGRLRALGFESEDCSVPQQVLSDSRVLTDSEWTRIKSQVIRSSEFCRNEREAKTREGKVREWWTTYRKTLSACHQTMTDRGERDRYGFNNFFSRRVPAWEELPSIVALRLKQGQLVESDWTAAMVKLPDEIDNLSERSHLVAIQEDNDRVEHSRRAEQRRLEQLARQAEREKVWRARQAEEEAARQARAAVQPAPASTANALSQYRNQFASPKEASSKLNALYARFIKARGVLTSRDDFALLPSVRLAIGDQPKFHLDFFNYAQRSQVYNSLFAQHGDAMLNEARAARGSTAMTQAATITATQTTTSLVQVQGSTS